jgi:hypothetical protein
MEPDESVFAWMWVIDAFLTKLSGLKRLFPGVAKEATSIINIEPEK